MSQESGTNQGGGSGSGSSVGGTPGNTAGQTNLRNLFIQGLCAILFLFIFIAAFQLYFSIQQFISTWFSEEYIPVVNSLYFLAVIAGGLFIIYSYVRGR